MNLGILGMGWVTPLGRGLEPVWQRLRNRETPDPVRAENPFTGKATPVFRVDEACLADAARLPRLRRSSLISHLAMAAALDAVADARLDPDTLANRTALVFAASDGGVIYTRRFFSEVAEHGARAGSPLLFPETVYNAPASHIAARLGIAGNTTTLVGDAASSIHAIAFAEDLIGSGQADVCIVVAAEETDWITSEACAICKITDRNGLRPPLADGAAALVIGHSDNNTASLDIVHPGFSAPTPLRAAALLETVLHDLSGKSHPALVAPSLTGSRFEQLESSAVEAVFPGVTQLRIKPSLGEAFAASALHQVIAALLWLRDRQPSAPPASAVVSVFGFSGHVSGLRLTAPPVRH